MHLENFLREVEIYCMYLNVDENEIEFSKYDPTDVCMHGRRASKDRRTDQDNPKTRTYESAKVPSLKCESISESLSNFRHV